MGAGVGAGDGTGHYPGGHYGDDFGFHYEDYALNTDLRPDPPGRIKSGDAIGTVKKVDDITISRLRKNRIYQFDIAG